MIRQGQGNGVGPKETGLKVLLIIIQVSVDAGKLKIIYGLYKQINAKQYHNRKGLSFVWSSQPTELVGSVAAGWDQNKYTQCFLLHE